MKDLERMGIVKSLPTEVRFKDEDLFFEALQSLIDATPGKYAYESGVNSFGVGWVIVHTQTGEIILFSKRDGEYVVCGSPSIVVLESIKVYYTKVAVTTSLFKHDVTNAQVKIGRDKEVHTYIATHNGQTFIKRTRRTYTNVIIARNPRWVPPSKWSNVWEEVAWCGRLELAWKQADAASDLYDEVKQLSLREEEITK